MQTYFIIRIQPAVMRGRMAGTGRQAQNDKIHIVNDMTNTRFRFLPKPYMEALAGPQVIFPVALTMRNRRMVS